jgi:hypothetical protein
VAARNKLTEKRRAVHEMLCPSFSGGAMDLKRDCRLEGYQDGLTDAKRTGGKVSKKYMDNMFENKTQHLTPAESCEFINGWEDGFADGILGTLSKMVHKDGVVKRQCCSFV